MARKAIDTEKTIESMLDKINNQAPAFAYHIPDMGKWKKFCRQSKANLKEMAEFVGVPVEFVN